MALFSLRAALGLDTSSFEAGLKRSQSAASSFASKAGSAAAGMAKGWLAAAVSAAALAGQLKKAVDHAGDLADSSARLGILPKTLQEFNAAALLTGGTLEHVVSFFEKLAAAREEALSGSEKGGKLADAFALFGIDSRTLQTGTLDQLARQIGTAFESGNAQRLIGPLKELGGKGAAGLIPAFAEGISGAADEAHRLGMILDNEVIANLDDLGDKLTTVGNITTAFFANMASSAIDGARTTVAYIQAAGDAVVEFFRLGKDDPAKMKDVDAMHEQLGKDAAINAYRRGKERGNGMLSNAADAVGAFIKAYRTDTEYDKNTGPGAQLRGASDAFNRSLAVRKMIIENEAKDRMRRFNLLRSGSAPEADAYGSDNLSFKMAGRDTGEMFGPSAPERKRVSKPEEFKSSAADALQSMGGYWFGAVDSSKQDLAAMRADIKRIADSVNQVASQ